MIKNRNYSLDLLRVIACYLVIQQHASEFYYIGEGGTVVTGDNTFWIGIITTLCRSSVPLFVLLSGFLLLPMQDKISTFFSQTFHPNHISIHRMVCIICRILRVKPWGFF